MTRAATRASTSKSAKDPLSLRSATPPTHLGRIRSSIRGYPSQRSAARTAPPSRSRSESCDKRRAWSAQETAGCMKRITLRAASPRRRQPPRRPAPQPPSRGHRPLRRPSPAPAHGPRAERDPSLCQVTPPLRRTCHPSSWLTTATVLGKRSGAATRQERVEGLVARDPVHGVVAEERPRRRAQLLRPLAVDAVGEGDPPKQPRRALSHLLQQRARADPA